jgi:hypothetical protein
VGDTHRNNHTPPPPPPNDDDDDHDDHSNNNNNNNQHPHLQPEKQKLESKRKEQHLSHLLQT